MTADFFLSLLPLRAEAVRTGEMFSSGCFFHSQIEMFTARLKNKTKKQKRDSVTNDGIKSNLTLFWATLDVKKTKKKPRGVGMSMCACKLHSFFFWIAMKDDDDSDKKKRNNEGRKSPRREAKGMSVCKRPLWFVPTCVCICILMKSSRSVVVRKRSSIEKKTSGLLRDLVCFTYDFQGHPVVLDSIVASMKSEQDPGVGGGGDEDDNNSDSSHWWDDRVLPFSHDCPWID